MNEMEVTAILDPLHVIKTPAKSGPTVLQKDRMTSTVEFTETSSSFVKYSMMEESKAGWSSAL